MSDKPCLLLSMPASLDSFATLSWVSYLVNIQNNVGVYDESAICHQTEDWSLSATAGYTEEADMKDWKTQYVPEEADLPSSHKPLMATWCVYGAPALISQYERDLHCRQSMSWQPPTGLLQFQSASVQDYREAKTKKKKRRGLIKFHQGLQKTSNIASDSLNQWGWLCAGSWLVQQIQLEQQINVLPSWKFG